MSGVVLVTGGAGYIGSHVSKALAESGFTPVCYDTLEKGHPWAVRWGPLECGDIGDAARLEEVFDRHKPRAIVHMAGYIEVGESVRQPERYLHNNATKSEVLVAAAVRHGVDAFVFSSTCAVYGMPQTEKLDENAPHRSIPTLIQRPASKPRSPAPPPRACVRHRCDILMPPAPTSAARSAKRTSRRRICCHWPSMRRWGSVLRSHC